MATTTVNKWTEQEETAVKTAKNIYDLREILENRSARSIYDKAKKLEVDTTQIEGLSQAVNLERNGKKNEIISLIETFLPTPLKEMLNKSEEEKQEEIREYEATQEMITENDLDEFKEPQKTPIKTGLGVKKHKWTDADDELIKSEVGERTIASLAEIIGTTPLATYVRIKSKHRELLKAYVALEKEEKKNQK